MKHSRVRTNAEVCRDAAKLVNKFTSTPKDKPLDMALLRQVWKGLYEALDVVKLELSLNAAKKEE